MEEGLYCPHYQRTVELIGGRWTGAIIRAMLGGVCRFRDLTSVVPGLSDRMLCERLRDLEAEGIISRVVVPTVPVRVEYHLTEKGLALSPVIEAIIAWLGEWTDHSVRPLPVATSSYGEQSVGQASTTRRV